VPFVSPGDLDGHIFTLFVAVLCSIGVCTDWLVSVVLAATVLIGGVAGRIVAGTRLGFVQGAVFGILFLLTAVFACIILAPLLFWQASWESREFYVLLGVAALIGGMMGGFTVRPRSGR